MSRTLPLSLLIILAGPAAADADGVAAVLAAIGDLGRLNGQALACSQMGTASQAKTLMIRHAPRTRRYGEVFEERTSEAFLAQGGDLTACPSAAEFSSRLDELSLRLQSLLPVGETATQTPVTR
ncbi:MAG: hypothetical protein FAZ92_03917 [Accumulibacter sp.]|jgi:hypothetical protein|uniref:hypothetical protein n=1 Tax=Accumulibacter sp. TaxID=2053492 RepID=UPI00120F0B16|nr:hypothetical protein [Accumulibacter sp.]QKS28623.1 MAG: hypothetical protein HT579_06620 [Candidatus Accumulibacter similis]TLD43820.1 MAG: hypothetical protein FAZ92_03917 [Accumulibacter sp.]